jgi:isoleucyl-tRNA synthetase
MDWLRNMRDWMISKKRYWGLALPFWECPQCSRYEVIGDELELRTRTVAGWDEFEGHTPHRPFIDAVKIQCPQCGGTMSRIPDVGNPWLDAGIVTFSTLRYRTDRDYWRKWYPAHWISESFPGQFRNWFYSMLVMGTVIDGTPSFLENFGYATLWAEDGRPMHKSWGNAIEFNDAADKMGVDVMRWLYCAQKPENNLLFGYQRADEVRRQFLIPLWNVYNFFVTYAKLDGWEPTGEGFFPATPEGATPRSQNLLDRWILARLNQVVGHCTQALENSDAYGAVDKRTAYATLYHVLVCLTKLLAPMTPFVTEVMYQNLVCSVQPDAYQSVHHCDWPRADESAIDEVLMTQMALARRIASLGLGARGSANIKVRQPLAKALVYAGDTRAKLIDELADTVVDELNVKALEFVAEEGTLVTYRILPDNRLLGPRFGKMFPEVRAALSAADPVAVVERVQAGLPVFLTVDGEAVELAPEEVLVQTQPAAGLAVSADKGVTVAVDAVITPELRAEGMAREIVRRVQTMRKNAGFSIDDRIVTYFVADGGLADVMTIWGEYIRAETLSTDLVSGKPPAGAHVEAHTVEGAPISLGVRRV